MNSPYYNPSLITHIENRLKMLTMSQLGPHYQSGVFQLTGNFSIEIGIQDKRDGQVYKSVLRHTRLLDQVIVDHELNRFIEYALRHFDVVSSTSKPKTASEEWISTKLRLTTRSR